MRRLPRLDPPPRFTSGGFDVKEIIVCPQGEPSEKTQSSTGSNTVAKKTELPNYDW